MRGERCRRTFLGAAFCVLASCQWPFKPDDPPTDAEKAEALYQRIRSEVFQPVCALCHAGETPAQFLNLSGDTSRQIIGRPSTELPDMRIVVPGQPDSSYILWKLEGRPGIAGQRMPWGMMPLPENQIQMFRDWILLLPKEGGPQSVCE